MRRLSVAILIAALLCTLPFDSARAEFHKTKLAVLDFARQGAGLDEDMGKIVAEWLITALVRDGRFEVVERRLLESVINEHKLVMSGVVDSNSAEELGNLLGVKIIITGSLMKFQDVMEVNARIIDVKDASIYAAESVKSSSAVKLEDMVKDMAAKIIRDFPLEGYIVSLEDSTAIIDLGEQAGVKPGMRFSVFKEGAVIKHPKTGEVLDVQRIPTAIVEVSQVRKKIAIAKIIQTFEDQDIEYGQMVIGLKSLEKIETAARPSLLVHSKPSPPVSKPDPVVPDNELAARLTSDDSNIQERAAREVYKKRPGEVDGSILDLISVELLKGCEVNQSDRHHIDAMGWFCHVLGRSGDKKYLDTLDKAGRIAQSSKIKGYANKNRIILSRSR